MCRQIDPDILSPGDCYGGPATGFLGDPPGIAGHPWTAKSYIAPSCRQGAPGKLLRAARSDPTLERIGAESGGELSTPWDLDRRPNQGTDGASVTVQLMFRLRERVDRNSRAADRGARTPGRPPSSGRFGSQGLRNPRIGASTAYHLSGRPIAAPWIEYARGSAWTFMLLRPEGGSGRWGRGLRAAADVTPGPLMGRWNPRPLDGETIRAGKNQGSGARSTRRDIDKSTSGRID